MNSLWAQHSSHIALGAAQCSNRSPTVLCSCSPAVESHPAVQKHHYAQFFSSVNLGILSGNFTSRTQFFLRNRKIMWHWGSTFELFTTFCKQSQESIWKTIPREWNHASILKYIIESCHKKAWTGRHLKDHIFPDSLSRTGHPPLDQVAQSFIRPGLKYFQACDILYSSWKHFPVPYHNINFWKRRAFPLKISLSTRSSSSMIQTMFLKETLFSSNWFVFWFCPLTSFTTFSVSWFASGASRAQGWMGPWSYLPKFCV